MLYIHIALWNSFAWDRVIPDINHLLLTFNEFQFFGYVEQNGQPRIIDSKGGANVAWITMGISKYRNSRGLFFHVAILRRISRNWET